MCILHVKILLHHIACKATQTMEYTVAKLNILSMFAPIFNSELAVISIFSNNQIAAGTHTPYQDCT